MVDSTTKCKFIFTNMVHSTTKKQSLLFFLLIISKEMLYSYYTKNLKNLIKI